MKILVAVYNTIEHDGRVCRAAEAVSGCAEVHVLAIDSGSPYSNPHFKVARVPPTPIPIIGKLISHPIFWFYFIRMARRLRPDVIHAHDFNMSLPGLLAARLSGAKLIYDAHELSIPEPGKRLKARDLFCYLLERWTVLRADIVIAANEERARLMQSHYKLIETPIVVNNIPPAPSVVTPDQLEQVLSRFPSVRRNASDCCLIVYQGDISIDRGIERFIKAIENMPEGYRIIVIGGGPDLVVLQARYRAFDKARKVNFLGKVSGDQLPPLLAACDAGIVTYSFEGLNNIYCASNKVFEYAHAGLPIVTTNQPPLMHIVSKYGIGECITREETPIQIADVIFQLANNIDKYRACIPLFLADNAWADEAARLKVIVNHLLNQNGL